MRISIADIKSEAGLHKRVELELSLEPVELGGQEVRFAEPFRGTAEIWNAGDRILVRAELVGEATLVCSRCLTSFTEPLSVSFEEEFVPEGSVEADSEEEQEESDRTVTEYSGDEIDLSEPLRDNILLELPMKPLCDEDCKGICPRCGTNLNQAECTCADSSEAVDPRLAALKDLLRKPDSNL